MLVTVLVVDQHGDGWTTSGTGPACRWRTALRQQATDSNGDMKSELMLMRRATASV